jgi:hypothetical protein
MQINLENYPHLKAEDLKVPIDSLISTVDKNNIKIVTRRPLEKHSEYEINLTLPYELKTCEGNIVNLVYYGLVGMSALFVMMSIVTLTYLYKE